MVCDDCNNMKQVCNQLRLIIGVFCSLKCEHYHIVDTLFLFTNWLKDKSEMSDRCKLHFTHTIRVKEEMKNIH